MAIVNNELLRLAQKRFSKAAAVPAGATDPAMAAGDPAMAAAGADPMAAVTAGPMDMAMAGGAAPMAPAPAPPPPAPAAPAPQSGGTGTGGQQKLKPEQMMQMIDYRMYNMQQQLTAIMNALGVQLPPEAIVLPPGSTSAPPAEAALPGGPGAPAPAAPPEAADPAAAGLPQDVYAGEDPAQTGGMVPPIPPNKAAWWQADEPKAASYIGDPVARNEEQPMDLQEAAAAANALYRSLMRNAR